MQVLTSSAAVSDARKNGSKGNRTSTSLSSDAANANGTNQRNDKGRNDQSCSSALDHPAQEVFNGCGSEAAGNSYDGNNSLNYSRGSQLSCNSSHCRSQQSYHSLHSQSGIPKTTSQKEFSKRNDEFELNLPPAINCDGGPGFRSYGHSSGSGVNGRDFSLAKRLGFTISSAPFAAPIPKPNDSHFREQAQLRKKELEKQRRSQLKLEQLTGETDFPCGSPTISHNDVADEFSGGSSGNAVLHEGAFDSEGDKHTAYSSDNLPAFPKRDISNQSTIDSAGTTLSGNSRTYTLNINDPNCRRMFARGASNGGGSVGGGTIASEYSASCKHRRVNLLMDQCETVRFPFKKKLILANMNLLYEDVPVDHICSDRLGSTLYKFSLAGNPLIAIPKPLIVKLTGLRILDLSQCDLRCVPEKWDLPSLKRLNLSHNRLEEFLTENIFKGLPDLQHLDMYGNKLVDLSLPRNVSSTSKLEYLDIGYNNLTCLPDELAVIQSLKTLKCMNNILEIVPAAVCEMDLRVFDVSSNPLIQPPLETCERGIYSMRRYYHCLKLEEMTGPGQQQQGLHNKYIFKKMKHEKPRSKMRKKKDLMRKTFPAALCRGNMFRSVSEPSCSASISSASTAHASGPLRAAAPSSESPASSVGRYRKTVPASSTPSEFENSLDFSFSAPLRHSGADPTQTSSGNIDTSTLDPVTPIPAPVHPFEVRQETPPVRSVSLLIPNDRDNTSDGTLNKSAPTLPQAIEEPVTVIEKSKPPTHFSDLSVGPENSIRPEISVDFIPSIAVDNEPEDKKGASDGRRRESEYSDDSASIDLEAVSSENAQQPVGLNEAEKVTDEVTVNDTLKVIFVGMALSGKTSIIKRLIEGRDAKIPQKDERTIGVDIYEWDPKSTDGEGDGDGSLKTQISVDGELQSRMKDNVDVKFSVWDFAGQHVYHATHELFFSSQSLYVLVWDMGANNTNTKKRRASLNAEQGAFKLTYDSSDEEDDFFDSEQEIRRTVRALEQDIDDKLQFWVDCIQSSAPGAAILPVASFDDYFSNGIGNEEALVRCKIMRERLQKHEERRVRSMEQRLEEYDTKFGAHSEPALRLRKLLCPFHRPKLIFGTDGLDSVVRVSSTNYTGFSQLAERIVNIATGRERGGWTYPVFRGHVGARIPRMRLEVRDVVRSMRDRFKVVEWGYFLSELKKKGIDNADDVSDALHFLANIGELSYFGDIATSSEGKNEAPDDEKKSSNLDEDGELVDEDEESSAMAPLDVVCTRQNSSRRLDLDPQESLNSLGLSEFIFLNPRWLVAAVACILRHDLTREIYEVRRSLRDTENLSNSKDICSEGESYHEMELKTDVNYPVITAQDACLLWQAKKFTKKAAERALEYSNNRSVTPFDFLQRLLVRFGVFVPIDLSIDKACLGGRDYSRYCERSDYPEIASNMLEAKQTPRFFFLPSLLGPGEPSEIWTFKTVESWKTTICHSILFPDGVPPGLMERITASVLSDLYSSSTRISSSDIFGSSPPPQRGADRQLRIKETLCWRSAFFLKIGKEVIDESTGVARESIVEIFATLVDQDSYLCVASDSMGVGMRRLIVSGKGQAGDHGSKIWKGGYSRVMKAVKYVMYEYGGLEIERQAVCPLCLAKKPIAQASVWDYSTIESFHTRGDQEIRCRYGHNVDTRLISGTTSSLSSTNTISNGVPSLVGEADIPVADLLKAVVIVGLWDENAQRIVRAGSGFIVDKKRGLIVTAGHTLMDRETWREISGKIVIGIIPKNNDQGDPVAVYRYFARIIAKDPSINEVGICKLDACVLQITTRMENGVLESGKEIGEQPETLLMNNPEAMKREKFDQLSVSDKFELDEAVRILGFNQGGEGLIGPGEELNRCADFARGYVVMKFAINEISELSPNRKFQPRSEIVVICPTIGGHSGGPCVNQQGEVIGILSRADPADRQRCYLVPSSEWKSLVKEAKRRLSSSRPK